MFRFALIAFIMFFSFRPACAQEDGAQTAASESDQQISEFSLAGYGEKGKKSWDIGGKSADIFENVVKLQDVVAHMYGQNEDIKLTADRGDFDKQDGRVHVEDNVVITTTTGAKLTTDSLDWDRKNQLVSTKDKVNIARDNMVTTATGAEGLPNLSHVTLGKDVQVDISPKEGQGLKDKIVITCDGPLEIDYAKNIATFKNNVKVDTQDNLIYSDLMDVYFMKKDVPAAVEKSNDPNAMMMGTSIDKIKCVGNVKIVRGQNTSYSDEALYTASDKRIVLTGSPKLILYSSEDLSASFGN
ncbi:MAG: LPS export ABC transporter periplasmic protein LptC [Candidatus Omnitrophota bacterium]